MKETTKHTLNALSKNMKVALMSFLLLFVASLLLCAKEELQATSEEKIIDSSAEFAKILKEHFPADLNKALPPEIVEIFRKTSPVLFTKNSDAAKFFMQFEKFLKEQKVKIRLQIINEEGKPIANARVQLKEILSPNNSKPLSTHGESVPYKKLKRTDRDGFVVFDNLDWFFFLDLSYWLFLKGRLPEENFLVTIRADGYALTTKKVVNVDKTAVALAVNMANIWVQRTDLLNPKGRREEDKLRLQTKITIPPENLGEIIEYRITMKKEKTEKNKNQKEQQRTSK